jgi:hypothetical protein
MNFVIGQMIKSEMVYNNSTISSSQYTSVGIKIKRVRSAHFVAPHIGTYPVLMFIYCRYKYITNSRSLLVNISINITTDLETQSITDITQHRGKTRFYFRSHRFTPSPSPRSFPYCQVLSRG